MVGNGSGGWWAMVVAGYGSAGLLVVVGCAGGGQW